MSNNFSYISEPKNSINMIGQALNKCFGNNEPKFHNPYHEKIYYKNEYEKMTNQKIELENRIQQLEKENIKLKKLLGKSNLQFDSYKVINNDVVSEISKIYSNTLANLIEQNFKVLDSIMNRSTSILPPLNNNNYNNIIEDDNNNNNNLVLNIESNHTSIKSICKKKVYLYKITEFFPLMKSAFQKEFGNEYKLIDGKRSFEALNTHDNSDSIILLADCTTGVRVDPIENQYKIDQLKTKHPNVPIIYVIFILGRNASKPLIVHSADFKYSLFIYYENGTLIQNEETLTTMELIKDF
ncbi:hypothetical protein DLAC_02421 [Tieghemostelium lacteum]|uniref:Uncharacterized protein n=1 Tax=Tieghemostelium lacteum TaxID=361077 RepID=A0A152A432_TIELA|nr:hypothetical protein DLAC_02421 [Tieghemostelium lacteum]|eukprot:KYR00980.1 hypothetical protein DLAC_02421 [Tieghemostelium lacteum]